MIYLFDNKENLISIVPRDKTSESFQDWLANGLITANCSVKYSDKSNKAVFFGAKDIDDPDIFWMYKIDKKNVENKVIHFEGTHIFFHELKGYGYIKDIRPKNKLAGYVANQILSGSRWLVGKDTTTHINSGHYYYKSRLTAWWDFVEKWAIEFIPKLKIKDGKIIERRVDIADEFSIDKGKIYAYGSNLIKVEAETLQSNIKTAFIGRGRGDFENGQRKIDFTEVEWSRANGNPADKPKGQNYLLLPEANEKYGYSDGTPITEIVEFDTDSEQILLYKTYLHAINNSRPLVHFSTTVVDTDMSKPFETVGIIRDDIGIRYKTKVFRLKRDFLNPKVREIEFGDKLVSTDAERQFRLRREINKTIDYLDYANDNVIKIGASFEDFKTETKENVKSINKNVTGINQSFGEYTSANDKTVKTLDTVLKTTKSNLKITNENLVLTDKNLSDFKTETDNNVEFLKSEIKGFEGDINLMSEDLKKRLEDAKKSIEKFESNLKTVKDEIWANMLNDRSYNYQLKHGNKYGLPSGFYSFDNPITQNPTKVIYIGAGKLAIANSKKADGTWNFKTFIDGDRVLADTLQTDNVLINKQGITVSKGAITIQDKKGKSVITSDGLKSIFQFESSGSVDGYQIVGWASSGGVGQNRKATFSFDVPEDFIILEATMSVTVGKTCDDRVCHWAKALRLSRINNATFSLSYPQFSDYQAITEGSSRKTVFSSWNPSENDHKKVFSIRSHVSYGTNTFMLETTKGYNRNTLNIAPVKFSVTLKGILKGG